MKTIRPNRLRIIPAGAAGAAEGAREIGVDDVGEVGIRHTHQKSVAGDAGVGDDDLDGAAELPRSP